MMLKPMSEADRLLFHAETLLGFIVTFADLQARYSVCLNNAFDEDERPEILPTLDLKPLADDLHCALLALHVKASR